MKQYRNPKKKNKFRVTEELESMRRFKRDSVFYIQVIVWALVVIGAILFGIFIRLIIA